MPRLSKSGKHIFSASEVSEFVLCQHAWYLGRVSKKPVIQTPQSIKGDELHEKWAKDYAEGLKIAQMLRLLVALFMTATVLMLLLGSGR